MKTDPTNNFGRFLNFAVHPHPSFTLSVSNNSHVRSSHLKEKHDINTVLEEGGVFPGELDVHVYPPLDVHVHPPHVVVEELQVCQKK